ncbi:hypothetical protein HZB78_00145 [Candidatus Collierbacteria bacterium]|nr:hypothetical protein [Candidatus Collierbacteria bacterium]
MKIVPLILIVIIIYLVREVTILKSNISTISNQKILLVNRYDESDSLPQLIQWSSEVSPNGKYRAASYTGDYKDRYHYYQIFITNLTNDRMNRIYSGDFRTSNWEWTDDNKINITYDCGTGCRATKIMGVDETVVHSEDKEGLISKENGWNVEFFKSF